MNQAKDIALTILANLCRMLLSATFLFSGFVKANDPMGTVYKLEDYFAAWSIAGIPLFMTLCLAIALALFEFALGLYLLMGMRRRMVSVVTLVFMSVMTLFTIYIVICNPVSDCGCFGDAIILTNSQTLFKNILLLACAIVVSNCHERQQPLMSAQVSWVVSTITLLAILVYASYCVYAQPVIDFRPYTVGANMLRLTELPAELRPKYEVTIVYERDGETLELNIDDDDPDSTWNYVETRRKEIVGVDKGNTSDFRIFDSEGEDITTAMLEAGEYILFLTVPVLDQADQSVMGQINELFDYAQEHDVYFAALTVSNETSQNRWIDYTGAEYGFYTCDDRVLKTAVRANPGLMMLHNGVIVGKWSNWNFPSTDEIDRLITRVR